jgi:hypothetical protein
MVQGIDFGNSVKKSATANLQKILHLNLLLYIKEKFTISPS